MTERNRYDYLDIAKGLGILAVVWAHIMLTGWSHRVIYAFHMPLFFFISGMLFRRERFSSMGQFVQKRMKRLFVPYVAYSVATWAIWALFRMARHDEVESYWMPLAQTVIAQGSGAFMVHNSALWFVPCLFATELMFFPLSRLRDWQMLSVSLVLAGLSFMFGDFFGGDYWFLLPWNLDAALIALPFYCVGNIISRHTTHQQLVSYANRHGWHVLLITLLLTVLLVTGSEMFGECSMGSSSYQCNGGIFLIRAFIGCLAMLGLSLLLGRYQTGILRFVKWMGINSLDVMCVHIPIKGVAMIAVAFLLKSTVDEISNSLSLSTVAFVLTMIAVSVLVYVVRHVVFKKK